MSGLLQYKLGLLIGHLRCVENDEWVDTVVEEIDAIINQGAEESTAETSAPADAKKKKKGSSAKKSSDVFAKFKLLHAAGKTAKEIAEELKVTTSTIYNWIKEL